HPQKKRCQECQEPFQNPRDAERATANVLGPRHRSAQQGGGPEQPVREVSDRQEDRPECVGQGLLKASSVSSEAPAVQGPTITGVCTRRLITRFCPAATDSRICISRPVEMHRTPSWPGRMLRMRALWRAARKSARAL